MLVFKNVHGGPATSSDKEINCFIETSNGSSLLAQYKTVNGNSYWEVARGQVENSAKGIYLEKLIETAWQSNCNVLLFRCVLNNYK